MLECNGFNVLMLTNSLLITWGLSQSLDWMFYLLPCPVEFGIAGDSQDLSTGFYQQSLPTGFILCCLAVHGLLTTTCVCVQSGLSNAFTLQHIQLLRARWTCPLNHHAKHAPTARIVPGLLLL